MTDHEHVYEWPSGEFGSPLHLLRCSCGKEINEAEIIHRVNGYEPMERENARLRKIEEYFKFCDMFDA